MITVIQRVISASIEMSSECVAQIEQGIVMLLAIECDDTPEISEKMINRVLAYRIFSDSEGRMNQSLRDVSGGLLIVPQFTLAADTHKGLRPSFAPAAKPELGRKLFEHAIRYAKHHYNIVDSGVFAADMQVHLINDGPVTFNIRIN